MFEEKDSILSDEELDMVAGGQRKFAFLGKNMLEKNGKQFNEFMCVEFSGDITAEQALGIMKQTIKPESLGVKLLDGDAMCNHLIHSPLSREDVVEKLQDRGFQVLLIG